MSNMALRWSVFVLLWFGGYAYGTGEGTAGTGCREGAPVDSKGREFIFAIPSPAEEITDNLFPFVIVTSDAVGLTVVNVSHPVDHIRHSVAIGSRESMVLNLTVDSIARGSGFFGGAVVIKASSDVSVKCLLEQHGPRFHTEGFLAIPTDGLGTDYFVLTFQTHSTMYGGNQDARHYSQFVVTATRDDTQVIVELSASATFNNRQRRAGERVQFVLNRAESAQIRSMNDLTGSKVTSSHPVSLVAGNDCSDVTGFFNYCFYLVEQLPPVATWGRRFVLAHWGPSSSIFTWRILAPHQNTTLTFQDNHLSQVTPGTPRWYDYSMYDKKAVLLTSSRAVLVVQYIASPKSSACVLCIPVEQYASEAVYQRVSHSNAVVQTAKNGLANIAMSSPLTIVYPCDGESDIPINGLEVALILPDAPGRLQDETHRYCAIEWSDPVLRDDLWAVGASPTGTHFSSVVLTYVGSNIVSAYPAGVLLESLSCTPAAGATTPRSEGGGIDVDASTRISTTQSLTTAAVANTLALVTKWVESDGDTLGNPYEGAPSKPFTTDANVVLVVCCSVLSVIVALLATCYAVQCVRRRCRRKNFTHAAGMRFNVRSGTLQGAQRHQRNVVDSIYSSLPDIPRPSEETRAIPSEAPTTLEGVRPSGITQRVPFNFEEDSSEIRRDKPAPTYEQSLNSGLDRGPRDRGHGVRHTYMALQA
ncbi:uncharacterized protein LOC110979831 isoform X2 [Acanthaster planci]|uniref:Uncharacterized protein LOC110979831 isoform X2 n=1 Tax=Acanthaster planci TaxID=133434 RepID=A0A8B7YEE8_ACAPL|nr:uncharacterized protein LOC110979831 isoform X2 [Acanthaster planci]